MTNNTNRTAEIAAAREADTRIAAAWAKFYEVNDKALALLASARKSEKALAQYSATMRPTIEARIERQREQAAAIEAEAAPLRDAANALDKELYKGWTRFFLVQHIHNTAHCSSFRPTTRVGWLPDVSGLTEAEAVAEYGATLCTVCFPSAPVELTSAAVDPTICPGRIDYDAPSRRGYHSGNYATCADCGKRVTLTPSGKLRKHKR